MKMNLSSLLKTASLPAALLIALLVQPIAFGGTLVADKDFNGDTTAMSGGNGAGLNQKGPPEGEAGSAGTWVANGYVQPAGAVDTNPNFGTYASSGLAAKHRVPSALGHAAVAGAGNDFQGLFKSYSGHQNMDAILQFDQVANTGDTVTGEFHVQIDKGSFTWGLVNDIAALKSFQAGQTWDGTGSRHGLPTHHAGNGSSYASGVTGQIAYEQGGNNTWKAITDNGSGTLDHTTLRNGAGDFLKSFGAAPNMETNWLQFEFEYKVGSDTFDKLQANYTTNGVDKVIYDVVTSSGVPIPVTSGSSIEGLVFSGGVGEDQTSIFIDEIYVEVTAGNPIPEPASLLLVLLGSCGLGIYRRR
jgi:hypothetical protein